VKTTQKIPGVYYLNWEDFPAGGDQDFNDLIAMVRVTQDRDGDGLWDDWETDGIDTTGDTVVDIKLPGANPDHKDIYLEIDYMDCAQGGCMPGDTHSHRPKPAAIDSVVMAFANAPVMIPDGMPGITLHLEVGNAIPHQELLRMKGGCVPDGPGGDFDTVKADPANFGANSPRRFAYHYALFIHRQSPTSTPSGCAEVGGNDFLVSFGGWNTENKDPDGNGVSDEHVGTAVQQAGVLMHELGHNLGLKHGGGDGINFKPNYLSVMNYWFQLSGIPQTVAGKNPFDYSHRVLATLNEASLDETVGIGGVAGSTLRTFYICPDFTADPGTGPATGAIDWNCDKDAIDPAVAGNISGNNVCVITKDNNGNGVVDTLPAGDDSAPVAIPGKPDLFAITVGPNGVCDTTASAGDQQFRPKGNRQSNLLAGFDDWNNLRYDFQKTTTYEEGDHSELPDTPELDFTTYRQALAPDLALSGTVSSPSVVTGSTVTYTINLTNHGPDVATAVVVSDALPASTTFVSCSATGGGECKGAGNDRSVAFPSLAAGASATITLVAVVNCPVADNAAISNAATVNSATPDRSLANNSATVTIKASNPSPKVSPPANVTAVAAKPGDTSVVVNYPALQVTDNCPGVAVVCSRPSGASFPLGVTTVTCTVTDAGGATADASFTVTVWDICLRDEGGGGILLFNSLTGDYQFTRCGTGGFTLTGRGRISRTGCLLTLDDGPRVSAVLDRCVIAPQNRGTARIRPTAAGATFTINDRNVIGHTGACP
jgi:uncharacterized repeat protein (TIGR01451 family)